MCVLYMIKVLSRKAFFPLRLLMLARKWKHLWSAAAAAAARICPLLLFQSWLAHFPEEKNKNSAGLCNKSSRKGR